MTTSAADGRPRLAFVQEADGFPTTSLAAAASGLCDLVWVVDRERAGIEELWPLLVRLGEVVDVAGMEVAEAASAIAERRPQGLLTLSDARLVWTAEVAELAGLAFVSRATAIRLADKHAQRSALEQGGLEVPRYWAVPPLGAATGWAELEAEVRFPAVLKPRQGAGSRHIVLAGSLGEVRSEAEAAATDPERAEVPLVLEEYLPDDPGHCGPFAGYVSVESLVRAGKVANLAVTGRLPLAEPFRETGFFMPSALSPELVGRVGELAASAAQALGVELGCLHTEIKLTPSGPVVIEVNGRLGGGMSELLGLAAGVELLPLAFRAALGEELVVEEMPRCHQVAFLLYLQAPIDLRRLAAVEGLEQLSRDPRVREIVLNRVPGASLDWREGNHGHVASVLGAASDHRSLVDLLGRIGREVVIVGG